MDNEQIIALAKLVKEKQANDARNGLKVGRYDIDMLLRITGSIKVGEDHDVAPTVSIPLKRALALFIVYAGLATSEQAMDALVRALYDSIELTGTSRLSDFQENEAAVNAMIARVENDLIAKLPRTYRRGPVTTSLKVEEFAASTPLPTNATAVAV